MYLIMDRFGVLDLEDGEEIPDPLPPNLRVLRVTRSPTKVLPLLPSTLNSISVTHSALDSIGNTDWHALVQLETVDLSHNNLKSFEINAPPNLASLKLEFNVMIALKFMFTLISLHLWFSISQAAECVSFPHV